MYVRRKVVNYALFEILMCVLAVLVFAVGWNQEIKEKYIGILAIVNVAIFIINLRSTGKGVFSISSLFVIFMYLFNTGVPIARLLNWIDESGRLFLQRRVYSMGTDTFLEFTVFAFLLISMLQVGIFCFDSKPQPYSFEEMENAKDNYNNQLHKCKQIGLICILLGCVPYFYGEIAYIQNALVYGYQNVESNFSLGGTGIGLIGNLFLLGMMMEFVYLQTQPKKFNYLFVAVCVYQIIRMFITGDRSTGVALILVLILIRHKYVSPIKGSKAVLWMILIYISLIFIKLVEMTRSIHSPTASEVIGEVMQSNILAETVFEYGGNIWSGMMVYYCVPASGSFRYGLTYLAAIIGKPLQILGITNEVWNFADFSVFLTQGNHGALIDTLTQAMGGSFSGEVYFNFGWFGILLIPIFGYYLAKFSHSCFSKQNNPVLSGYLLYVATLVIWWVRQYFTSVSWQALFYGVVIFVLYSVLSRRSAHRRRTSQ